MPIGMLIRKKLESIQTVVSSKSNRWSLELTIVGVISGILFAAICAKLDQLVLGTLSAVVASLAVSYFVTIWNTLVVLVMVSWGVFEGRFVYFAGAAVLIFVLFEYV
ncbi:hypothetical protein GCM10017056_46350 [Seohaeicola zhoushanensis]|uniref:Uncharacterized protein n=1 Tax=Seohaeicola zhoushanensis TaxID=1569283 RepID=A0A8J3MC10_9RHOB|nr:hypothetical protein GCM10017056_46350 [Seohaeicola zhoushanensis]